MNSHMPETSAPFILADQQIIANPYDLYDGLRETAPIHEISNGVYFLSRYADCAAALLDHRRLSNRPAPFAFLHDRHRTDFVGADIARNLIAFRDAPDVTPARKALATEFMAFVRGHLPGLKAMARDGLRLPDSGTQIEFVSGIALPFALESTCRLIGFPHEDVGRLKSWSSDFFLMFHAIPSRDALIRLNSSLAEFRAYTEAIVRARLDHPRDDLISHLSRIDREKLDVPSLVDNVMLLAADGVENVWAGMANALTVILGHLDEVETHLEKGTSWNAILTECLRLESPAQYQGRIVAEPLEIRGETLRKYSVVLVGLAAANRDPAVFDDPSAFHPGRKGARDLSFGLGPHACLGRSLVDMQMVALFEALRPHLRQLRCEVTDDLWQARAGHRWLSSLPISYGPGSSTSIGAFT